MRGHVPQWKEAHLSFLQLQEVPRWAGGAGGRGYLVQGLYKGHMITKARVFTGVSRRLWSPLAYIPHLP